MRNAAGAQLCAGFAGGVEAGACRAQAAADQRAAGALLHLLPARVANAAQPRVASMHAVSSISVIHTCFIVQAFRAANTGAVKVVQNDVHRSAAVALVLAASMTRRPKTT